MQSLFWLWIVRHGHIFFSYVLFHTQKLSPFNFFAPFSDFQLSSFFLFHGAIKRRKRGKTREDFNNFDVFLASSSSFLFPLPLNSSSSSVGCAGGGTGGDGGCRDVILCPPLLLPFILVFSSSSSPPLPPLSHYPFTHFVTHSHLPLSPSSSSWLSPLIKKSWSK